jgi:hypothetical protein
VRSWSGVKENHQGCERTVGVGETDGKGRLLRWSVAHVGRDIVDPGTIRSNVGRQRHLRSDCESHRTSALMLTIARAPNK